MCDSGAEDINNSSIHSTACPQRDRQERKEEGCPRQLRGAASSGTDCQPSSFHTAAGYREAEVVSRCDWRVWHESHNASPAHNRITAQRWRISARIAACAAHCMEQYTK